MSNYYFLLLIKYVHIYFIILLPNYFRYFGPKYRPDIKFLNMFYKYLNFLRYIYQFQIFVNLCKPLIKYQ